MLDDPPREGKVALLLGPLSTHQLALDAVELCRTYAVQRQPWLHFNLFGTCRIDPSYEGALPTGAFTDDWPLEYVPGTQLVRPGAANAKHNADTSEVRHTA